MEYEFDSKEKYTAFLDKIISFCTRIDIIDVSEDSQAWCALLHRLEPYLLSRKWTRKFPGQGRSGNLKVWSFNICAPVKEIFSEYDSLFLVGYDFDEELGIDMAFYKNNDLVLFVVNHEDLCFIEDKFVSALGL